MPATTARESLYAQLEVLPENVVGELINGRLHTHPRPAGPHAIAHSILNMDIGSAYQRGRGGPGGWWIITEPEIHFMVDQEVVVPEIAGWRRERMPKIPVHHRFTVSPDWVCEVLSPSTAKIDRIEKMPLYACYSVVFLWLVDPLAHTLEAFALDKKHWTMIGTYQDDAEVCVAPFPDITLQLADLWTET